MSEEISMGMAAEAEAAYWDELDAALAAVKERLEADPFFADVPVHVDDEADLVASVRQALDLAGGVAVVIGVPDLRNDHPNLPGPQFGEVVVDVAVHENVALNRTFGGTRKTARRIARQVARDLHHARVAHIGKSLLATRISSEGAEGGVVTFAVELQCGGIGIGSIWKQATKGQ